MTEIARFAKNRREEVRVTVERWRGFDIINLRVWYIAPNGQLRPRAPRLALRLEQLDELRAALVAADANVSTSAVNLPPAPRGAAMVGAEYITHALRASVEGICTAFLPADELARQREIEELERATIRALDFSRAAE